jgi:hypothetical protein
MPNASLPDRIEIFRPGRHIDDAGGVHEFSEADVAGMAAAYDPALREAPLCVGHPAHNRPAYGWVAGLQVNAEGRLEISGARAVEAQFAEMVTERRFPTRSASFYPKDHPNNPKPGAWYLRHVAFLGAQPPAIAGLKDFAEDPAGTVNFSEAVPPEQEQDMSKELQAQLDEATQKTADAETARAKAEAEAADAKAKLAQFAEQQRTERHAGFVSFAEAMIEDPAGAKLLPKDKEPLVAVLDILADAQPVEFAEGGATKKLPPAEWLKGLIASAKPVVSFGEFAPGNAGGAGAGNAKGKSDAEVDAEAKAYMRQHKVSYAEAARAVVGFTS